MTSNKALSRSECFQGLYRMSYLLPFDSALFRRQAALNAWKIGLDELHHLFEVRLLATEITFPNIIFALSSCSPAHLSPSLCQRLLTVRPDSTDSIAGPMRSRPILAPWRITRRAGRLIPAARLHVATMTLIVPLSYASATIARSSMVIPASLQKSVYTFSILPRPWALTVKSNPFDDCLC